jgi:hypothetical protein
MYYSLEDLNNSFKSKTTGAKNEESPYVDSNDSYDVLRQKRNKKMDLNERIYSGGFILEEGEEVYDHTNTSSRVLDDEHANTNDHRISKPDPQSARSSNALDVPQISVSNVPMRRNSRNSSKAPMYASVRKSKRSSYIDRKSRMPEPLDMTRIVLSTDGEDLSQEMDEAWEKLQNQTTSTTEQDPGTAGQEEPVYYESDVQDPTPGSAEEPVYDESDIQDPTLGTAEAEEPVYEESDVAYDQLRRQRTRRNKNLGVKVSIYSELNTDNPNYEDIYSTTESAGRIQEEEPVSSTGGSPSVRDGGTTTDLQNDETDKSDVYAEISKI